MKNNGKDLYEQDIDTISYEEIGKYKFNFIVTKKDGEEVKITRKLGNTLLKAMQDKEA
jgi:hypothetical protein